jgi:uncharacterized protein
MWRQMHAVRSEIVPLGVDTMGNWPNEAEIDAYRGNWWHQMRHRAWESWRSQVLYMGDYLRCGGCILIGMALLRLRFFHGEWSRGAYAALACLLAPIGWIITYMGVAFMNHIGWKEYPWDTSDQLFSVWGLGVEFNYWGSLITELGYISFGVLLAFWAAEPARRVLRICLVPLRSIGRMALTCYILESVIGTTLFYGHGFGWYGRFWRVELLEVVAGVWVFLMIFATVWMHFFRQGPLEWVWHRIVYWRGEPPALKDPTVTAAA